MRISTGILKGLYIKSIPGIRPTQDKVKNAIFNILQNSIQGVNFLELFAGSGIVGFEAASRGAKEVVFVDNHPLCIKSIKDTIDKICRGTARRASTTDLRVFKQDSSRAIENFYAEGLKFDIIFADPPYPPSQKTPPQFFGGDECGSDVRLRQDFGEISTKLKERSRTSARCHSPRFAGEAGQMGKPQYALAGIKGTTPACRNAALRRAGTGLPEGFHYEEEAKKILQTLSRYDIIYPTGLLIIQAHRKEILDESYGTLRLIRSYKYGDTVLKVYKKIDNCRLVL